MKTDRQRKMAFPGKTGKCLFFAGVFCLLPFLSLGCLSTRSSLEKKMMSDLNAPGHEAEIARAYRVFCPDVIEITVVSRPNLHWRTTVEVDGCLPIPELGNPRAEGRTIVEIARDLAPRLGVPVQDVLVEVKEYRSKQVYLLGQIKNAPQSLPYRGPETVLDLLQRAGGITAGAEPNDVFVIRSNIAEGKRPEVFHVDLRAIVLKKDDRTNVRLQPFDQVHVGETRQALVERCIPPWMRPMHWVFWDTRPDDKPPRLPLPRRLFEIRQNKAERAAERK